MIFYLATILLIFSAISIPPQYYLVSKNMVTDIFGILPFFLMLFWGTEKGKHFFKSIGVCKFIGGIVLFTLAYLLYVKQIGEIIKAIVIIAFPFLILFFANKNVSNSKITLRDVLILIYIFTIIVLRFLPMKILDFSGPPPIFQIDLLFLIMIHVALFIFIVMREIKGIGYSLDLGFHDIKTAVYYYVPLTLIITVAGLYTGFLKFKLPPSFLESLLALTFYFLFVAIIEEIFFRGFIMNFFMQSIKGRNANIIALFLSSFLFGLAHLASLDIRYFIFAIIAGLFYGSAYLKTGKLTSSILLHGMIDITWVLFLYNVVVT